MIFQTKNSKVEELLNKANVTELKHIHITYVKLFNKIPIKWCFPYRYELTLTKVNGSTHKIRLTKRQRDYYKGQVKKHKK